MSSYLYLREDVITPHMTSVTSLQPVICISEGCSRCARRMRRWSWRCGWTGCMLTTPQRLSPSRPDARVHCLQARNAAEAVRLAMRLGLMQHSFPLKQ